MKQFFRSIHLYLGLASGVFIMVLCLTGAILVFEKELDQAFHQERYIVTPGKERFPLTALGYQVEDRLASAVITGFKVYAKPDRTVEVNYTDLDAVPTADELEEIKEAKKEGKKIEIGRRIAYLDPYTGEIKAMVNPRESFFHTVEQVHRSLVAGEVGEFLTGFSTLFFLFILITGIILWWPKTRAKFEKRFTVKWNSGWKRLNHDFHIVLGFYSAIFLFIFAFTALAWSFKWFNKGIYVVTGSEMKPPKQVETVFQSNVASVTPDSVVKVLAKPLASAANYQISFPKDSTGTYTVNMLPQGVYEMQTETYWVDPYNGKLLDQQAFADKNLGQRVRASFKPIHTASIYGWPSKLIGLLVCLLGVTFPVTGFILWRNRLAKKK